MTMPKLYVRLLLILVLLLVAPQTALAVNILAPNWAPESTVWSPLAEQTSTPLDNPHDGYDTSSNSCSICHSGPTADGAYFLLRQESQDDACDYCHVGGSAFASAQVYDLNSAGVSTSNGHAIGLTDTIPDSAVEQWTESTHVTVTDENGMEKTETIPIRRYSATRNKMFRLTRHEGSRIADPASDGYMRVGPLALNCMNCHHPHNNSELLWRPPVLETQGSPDTRVGYKLLRKAPSGSIHGSATVVHNGASYSVNYDEGMRTWRPYMEFDPARGEFYVEPANVVAVPEETMTAANTGPGHTIYTAFTGADAKHRRGPTRDPQTVNQYALSPWCADCHNLNVGYWKGTPAELGFKSHSDRTHPAPFTGASNGPGQCYSCHRNDLPAEPSAPYYSGADASCERCHFGTGSYAMTHEDIDGRGTHTDFPHSGSDDAFKLLGPVGTTPAATAGIASSIDRHIDGVCLRCHIGAGTHD